jgi:hypothetical protein
MPVVYGPLQCQKKLHCPGAFFPSKVRARRLAFAATLVVCFGGVAFCVIISPYSEDRNEATEMIGSDRLQEEFALFAVHPKNCG